MKKSPREFIHKYNQFIRDYNLLMANITEYLWYTGNETIPFTVYNWLFFFLFSGILWVIPIFPIRPPTEAPVWNRQKTTPRGNAAFNSLVGFTHRQDWWATLTCFGLTWVITQTQTIHGTGIFTYIWLILMVHVGKYTIHGSYGR